MIEQFWTGECDWRERRDRCRSVLSWVDETTARDGEARGFTLLVTHLRGKVTPVLEFSLAEFEFAPGAGDHSWAHARPYLGLHGSGVSPGIVRARLGRRGKLMIDPDQVRTLSMYDYHVLKAMVARYLELTS